MRVSRIFAILLASGVASLAGAFDDAQLAAERFPNLHPALAKATLALEADPTIEYMPGLILVQFNEDSDDTTRELALASVGADVIQEYDIVPGLFHVAVDGAIEPIIAVLNILPGVEYAEPDFVVHTFATPNDSFFGSLWGLHNTGQTVNGDPGIADADIDAPEAWDIITGDPNFIVADIDTGMQYTHPDLDANVWSNPNETTNGVDDDGNGYIDDIRGWDFYSNDNNPSDGNGHGTHTAGTIMAEGNNGTGVTGVCWRGKIAILQFLGSGGSGSTSGAISAVQYATNKGFKVSNNSWGGGGFSQSLYNAINASKSVGHIFVAAAGNDGSSQASYPARYDLDNIISVAATDNNDNKASFSQYNSVSVDLGAPGVNIRSTYSGSSYAYLSGTSMATPHVSGAVALVYQRNPSFTYLQIRQRIFDTVRPAASMAGRTVTGGILNLAAAVAQGGGNLGDLTALSNASHDGRIRETTEASGVGGTTDALNALRAGDSNNRQQWVSIVSFDTSGIPDNATILTASLKLYCSSTTGNTTTLGTLVADIRNGGFNGNNSLESADFQAAASASAVATLNNPLVPGLYAQGSLNSAGLAQISKTGFTQLRVRFSTDDDNDSNADFLEFATGSVVGYQPQLIIQYSTP